MREWRKAVKLYETSAIGKTDFKKMEKRQEIKQKARVVCVYGASTVFEMVQLTYSTVIKCFLRGGTAGGGLFQRECQKLDLCGGKAELPLVLSLRCASS